jgi:WS/DGAT/MGAT family acyltransferase
VPGAFSLFAKSAVRLAVSPVRAMQLGYEVVRSLPGLKPLESLPALVGIGKDESEILSRPRLVAPHSRLNGQITAHRRWAFGDVSLESIKLIKDAAGTTVNDVVIAVASGAVRQWLLEHEDVPHRSLQALIPISIRAQDDRGEFGNRVSAIIAPIGTHVADPVERLDFVHRTMGIAKDTHHATPATLLQDFAEFAPPAIAARAAQIAYRNGRGGRWTPFNLVISNIPGPDFPLYLAGARLEGHYPVSTITDGAALNITLHRYLDHLCFGLVGDRDLIPDLWRIMDLIHAEVAELEKRLT